MKKFYLLTALMCLFVLQGCPSPDTPPAETDELTPIQTTYSIGAEGGSVSISFKTNLEYKVSSDADWLTVPASTKAVETKTVTVTAAANTSTEQRSGHIIIKGGDLTATITVKQAGITPSIKINGATSFVAPAEGYNFSVDVISNVDYSVNVSADWIKDNGGNSFSVEANDSESDRSATIDFCYGNLKESVTVKQNGKEEEPYIEVGTTTYSVAAAGGPVTVNVVSNVEYQTSISAGWVSGDKGNLSVEANETDEARSATVTYTYGEISKSVTINQAAKNVLDNGGPAAYNVPAAGETIEVVVRSNVDYKVEVSAGADWISQAVTKAAREDHLKFIVAANEIDAERSAAITVSYEEMDFTVTVNQEAKPVLTPIQTTYSIGAEGGSVNISFKTNLEYKVSSDASWLTVPASTKAAETKTVTVTAEANASTEQRSGNITIDAGDLTATITVNQAGIIPSIKINGAKSFVAPAENYNFSVDVISNVDYSVNVSADWIKDNGGNSFSVEANDSESERSATIDFCYGDLKESVTVRQNGKKEEPYIEVGATTYRVEAAGGPVTVNVVSNVEYRTSISAGWVSGDKGNLSVEANETDEARSATVTYTYGEISKSVTINQAAKNVLDNGGPAAYNVPAAGETIEVVVRSNVAYKVDVSADWIKQAVTKAVSEDRLSFIVAANDTEVERNAAITVSYEDMDFTVTVNQEAKPVLTPIETIYKIGAEGGGVSISFKTNLECKVISDASWLTVPPSTRAVETKTVTVTADANTSTEKRSGHITIDAGDLNATITVEQAGITPSIKINGATSFVAPAEGYNFSVDVISNVDYEVSVNGGWIKKNGKENGKENFSVEANDSESERSTTIDFYYGDLKESVTVKQNGKEEEPYIEVGTTTYRVEAAGGAVTVAVTSNVDYQTSISETWVSGDKGNLKVAANETFDARTATVTYTYGDITKSVTIKQAAKSVLDIDSSTTAFKVPAAGETIEVIVRSNVEYKVDVSEDWISQVVTKAVSEDHLSFIVAANESEVERNATITVSYGEMSFAVTVNQEAYEEEDPYLEISPETLIADAAGGTFTINVSVNNKFKFSCPDNWVTVTLDGEIATVAVEANTSTDSRSATINFASMGINKNCNITQKAAKSDEDPFDVGSDLSVNGTANCYVVTKAGTYTFDAKVMGNGEEGILWDDQRLEDALLWPKSKSAVKFSTSTGKRPETVEVLWQKDGDGAAVELFEEAPSYDGKTRKVTIKTNGNKGNAVLVIKTKSGTVLWSWHIWCTDSPQFNKMESEEGDIVLLDRNLGATSADPADGRKTYGLWYQWGRKDPLCAYVGIARDMKTAEAEMQTSVEHPDWFFSMNRAKTNEWFAANIATVEADLWGNPKYKNATQNGIGIHQQDATLQELKKTIYDPCPPGYMVACEKAWELVDAESVKLLDNGITIPDANGELAFYPYTGFISDLNSNEHSFTNQLGWFSYAGYEKFLDRPYRAVNVYTSQTGIYGSGLWDAYGANYFGVVIYSEDDKPFVGISSHIRQYGRPVRCMKMPSAE